MTSLIFKIRILFEFFLCMHVVTNTPAGPMEAVRSYSSISGGLPHLHGGSAPALGVSRPARCSLTLQPTCSRSRLNGPLHRRLRRLRYLCRRCDCYRVERTSSRAGLTPAGKHRLSRRTCRGSLMLCECHFRISSPPDSRRLEAVSAAMRKAAEVITSASAIPCVSDAWPMVKGAAALTMRPRL